MTSSAPSPVPAPTLRGLLTLAAPMMLARATQAVDGFADTYQVSHLGEDMITATSTGGLNCFGLLMLPFGLAFIIQSFVAQLVGAGRVKDKATCPEVSAKAYVRNGSC